MTSDRWIFRSFRKDKIRFLERYHHNFNQTDELPKSLLSKDALILIPDGQFIRKYLRFFEEYLLQHSSFHHLNRSTLLFLESAAEVMDHRYNSPSISLSSDERIHTESTAINERKRIVKLWNDYKIDSGRDGVSIFSFADLSFRVDDDDFDLFGYEDMAIKDRSRCALVRAAQLISMMAGYNGARVILLSEDELLLGSNNNEPDGPRQIMNCELFISFFVNDCMNMTETEKDFVVEHWKSIQKSCEEEYFRRNTSTQGHDNDIETDKHGHFEHFSNDKLQEGISQRKFFRGALKVTNANSKEAFCTVQTSDGSKINYYLNEMNGHFNRAIHEDNIVIEPLPQEMWEQPVGKRRLVHTIAPEEENKSVTKSDNRNAVPTARAVGTSHNNNRRRKYVATMLTINGALRREENSILVVPMDMKIPPIRIKTRISHDNLEHKRLLVEIDGWKVFSSQPYGHFVKILGDVGDLDTEIDCLLRENRIDISPFSANALACLPSVTNGGDWKIDGEELRRRCDLRKTCRVFSVDPVGCQDIDDAMHARGKFCTAQPQMNESTPMLFSMLPSNLVLTILILSLLF
jgi:hypothetical protein